MLSAWREAPFYNARERSALAWCEALTLLPSSGAPVGLRSPVGDYVSPHRLKHAAADEAPVSGGAQRPH